MRKELKEIKNISLIENAKLNTRKDGDYDTFIAIEDYEGIQFLYDITTGEDLSFIEDNYLYIEPKKTKISQLYSFNPEDIQCKLKLSELDTIIFYKHVRVMNINTKKKSSISTDCLEFKYKDGTIIYVDTVFNELCQQKNSVSIVKLNKTKQINVYKTNESYSVTKYTFKNILMFIESLFVDFV